MSSLDRRHVIAERVRAQGSVRIDALAEEFGVSAMTIHRDLDHLHSRGVLRKVRSGAEARPSEAFEHHHAYRADLNVPQKRAIAAAALRWAADRGALQAVALDDSTTALHLVPALKERGPLTVVSNFLPVLTAFATEPEVRLTAVGGEFVPEFASFGGSSAVAALADLHYDVVFMSVTAVSDGACFHPSRATADLKRAFLRSAELRVLLADHTKFTRRAVHRIGNLAEFDVVVVDAETDPADVDAVRAAGVELVVAEEAHP
ncbi:DeoR/GlpR family DNA-binding transcription regulator [Kineococcus endophyticus]|uniref:Lactose phosphotransferase system repressor n=1 Tax=Kineococcus endophyticus TaxID=1181883 RepID=A0ABV3P6A8_9ACTN